MQMDFAMVPALPLTAWLSLVVGCLAAANKEPASCPSNIRLANSTTSGHTVTGILQVEKTGSQHIVCSDPVNLYPQLAHVLCRQLGYSAYVPPNERPDKVLHASEEERYSTAANCNGQEPCISQCEGFDRMQDWTPAAVADPSKDEGTNPCYEYPVVPLTCTLNTTKAATSAVGATGTSATTVATTATRAAASMAATAATAAMTTRATVSTSATPVPTAGTTTKATIPTTILTTTVAAKTSTTTKATTVLGTALITIPPTATKLTIGTHTSTVSEVTRSPQNTSAAANSTESREKDADTNDAKVRSVLIGCFTSLLALLLVISVLVVYKCKRKSSRSELKRRLYESGDNPAYMGTADYETISRDAQVLSADSSSVLADNVYLIARPGGGGQNPGLVFSNPALASCRSSIVSPEGYRSAGIQTPDEDSIFCRQAYEAPMTPINKSLTFPDQGVQNVSQSTMLLKEMDEHSTQDSTKKKKKKKSLKRRKSKSAVEPLCEELPVSVIPSVPTADLIGVHMPSQEHGGDASDLDSTCAPVTRSSKKEPHRSESVPEAKASLQGNNHCMSTGIDQRITVGMITPRDFVCPLTGRVMHHPVKASDGHTYEEKALAEWLQNNGQVSPLTGEALPAGVAIPDAAIRGRIAEWRHRRKQQRQDMKKEVERSSGLQMSGVSC